MTKLYLMYPTDQSQWMAHSVNSCVAAGVDEANARLNVLEANKPKGFIDPAKLERWTAVEIADGSVSLPTGAAVQWMGKCWGPALPMPGA